jgi:hypothetical protein
LLLKLVEAVQDLAGAILDHVSPADRTTIADVQARLAEMRREYRGGA